MLSRLHFIPYEESQHIIIGVFDEQHIGAEAETDKNILKTTLCVTNIL